MHCLQLLELSSHQITEVVDSENPHSLDTAFLDWPEETVLDSGLAVKPQDSVLDKHLVSRIAMQTVLRALED